MSTPAISTTTFGNSTTATELTTMAAIATRYQLPGPHVTVVVPLPTPGTVGDDLGVRWSSTRADLHHLGASAQAVQHIDAVLASRHRRGRSLLVTATEVDAAFTWLAFDIEPTMHVGPLPALVPAIGQVTTSSSPTIAAVVDRVGGDLYVIDAFDIAPIDSVDGEDEQIHKAATGGWSQKNHQRHSEVIWDRNAALVASTISTHAAHHGDHQAAGAIVLTGDDRAVGLVERHLAAHHVSNVTRHHAGGRHEPGTVARVQSVALDERSRRSGERCATQLAELREELGQHDRAVGGSIPVLEAITENRVRTLFVDIDRGRADPHVDALVGATLAHGGDVVVGPDFDIRDGIAALLRMPYQ